MNEKEKRVELASPDAAASPINDPSYFGGCPTCGQNDGYRNLGRSHWFYCQRHRLRWCAGENLFSSWRGENDEIWNKNWALLEGFKEVKPLYPS